MTQIEENVEVSGIESKFTRIGLTIIAALLIFVGPTYIPYLIADNFGGAYVASVAVGAVLFIVGLVMLIWLARKKVFT